VCRCSNGFGGPAEPLGWYCLPTVPGCPYPTPAIGTECSQPGLVCGLSCDDGTVGVECGDGGTWQDDNYPCPI
jgi:hypothetical protein